MKINAIKEYFKAPEDPEEPEYKSRIEQIKFYDVSGLSIDHEVREVIEGFDKLLFLRRNNVSFYSLLTLSLVISLTVLVGYRMAYDSKIDNDVNKYII